MPQATAVINTRIKPEIKREFEQLGSFLFVPFSVLYPVDRTRFVLYNIFSKGCDLK